MVYNSTLYISTERRRLNIPLIPQVLISIHVPGTVSKWRGLQMAWNRCFPAESCSPRLVVRVYPA